VSTQRGLRPKRLLAMEQAELNCNLYWEGGMSLHDSLPPQDKNFHWNTESKICIIFILPCSHHVLT
jgi:hypothetical protein